MLHAKMMGGPALPGSYMVQPLSLSSDLHSMVGVLLVTTLSPKDSKVFPVSFSLALQS